MDLIVQAEIIDGNDGMRAIDEAQRLVSGFHVRIASRLKVERSLKLIVAACRGRAAASSCGTMCLSNFK